VKSSDDHERYLSCEEDSNDYDQHQGGALGIPLLPAFSDHAATGNVVIVLTSQLYADHTNLPLFFREEDFSTLLSPLLLLLVLIDLLLISLFLLWSALLKAEQRRILSTTREMHGRRWTKRTRNLK
jgi:hypothetical protein